MNQDQKTDGTKIWVKGCEYTTAKDGGMRCNTCGYVVKTMRGLQTHPTSKSHLNYRENSDNWREKKGIPKSFVSLLVPNLVIDRD